MGDVGSASFYFGSDSNRNRVKLPFPELLLIHSSCFGITVRCVHIWTVTQDTVALFAVTADQLFL